MRDLWIIILLAAGIWIIAFGSWIAVGMILINNYVKG